MGEVSIVEVLPLGASVKYGMAVGISYRGSGPTHYPERQV